MHKSPIRTTSEATLYDVEVAIEYFYHPFCKGRYEDGLQMDPDEPAEVELISVTLMGQDVLKYMADDDVARLKERLLEEGAEASEPDWDAIADAREAREERQRDND